MLNLITQLFPLHSANSKAHKLFASHSISLSPSISHPLDPHFIPIPYLGTSTSMYFLKKGWEFSNSLECILMGGIKKSGAQIKNPSLGYELRTLYHYNTIYIDSSTNS